MTKALPGELVLRYRTLWGRSTRLKSVWKLDRYYPVALGKWGWKWNRMVTSKARRHREKGRLGEHSEYSPRTTVLRAWSGCACLHTKHTGQHSYCHFIIIITVVIPIIFTITTKYLLGLAMS